MNEQMLNVLFLDPSERFRTLAKRTGAVSAVDPCQSRRRSTTTEDWLRRVEEELQPHLDGDSDRQFIVVWHADPEELTTDAPVRLLFDLAARKQLPRWWRGVVFFRGSGLKADKQTSSLRKVFPERVAVVPYEVFQDTPKNPAVRHRFESFVAAVRQGNEQQAFSLLRSSPPPENLLATALLSAVSAAHPQDATWPRLLTTPLLTRARDEFERCRMRFPQPADWPTAGDDAARYAVARNLIRKMVANSTESADGLSEFRCDARGVWGMWKHDHLGQRLELTDEALQFRRDEGWTWLQVSAPELITGLRQRLATLVADFSPKHLVPLLAPFDDWTHADRDRLCQAVDEEYLRGEGRRVAAFAARLAPLVERFTNALELFIQRWPTGDTDPTFPRAVLAPLREARNELLAAFDHLPSGIVLP